MRTTGKTIIFSLLALATLVIPNASATLILPESHYGGGAWQGSSYYNEGDFYVRIDFAVYDTWSYPADFTWAGGVNMPETDQFIYAYQIFNHPNADEEVAYFQILDIERNPISESRMNSTCSQNDGQGGIASDPTVSTTQGVWEWSFDGGYMVAGEHSWFLILSSAHAPVVGDYEISSTPESEDPLIPGEIPEPAMLTLLGLGGILMLRRRRRKPLTDEKRGYLQ